MFSYCNISKIINFQSFKTTFFSTSSSILDLCTKPNHLQQIHARFILHGLHQNPTLSSKLIDCYAKFGLLNLSQNLFYFTQNPDSLLYNSLLRNLSQFGEHEKTLFLYKQMVEKCMYPNEESFSFVLRSCFEVSYGQGMMVYGQIVKLGMDGFDLVRNGLVDLYDIDGFLNGHQVFEKMPVREMSYWNGLIYEACEGGKMEESFELFFRMRKENVKPNSVTVINFVDRCLDVYLSFQLN